MKTLLLLSIGFCFQSSFWAQQSRNHDGKPVSSHTEAATRYSDSVSAKKSLPATKTISGLEIPATLPEEFIIRHTAYSLVYIEEHEQAKWVAYELTEEKTSNKFERTNKFMVDPLVITGSANDKDYEKSKYDRGHLAPAADMGWSETTAAESFYYSNMSPQVPSFNRGIWKKAEELARSWAIENKQIYIVTGPVLTAGLKTIGPNQVSVPNYYYKVILDYSQPDIKGIGFIIPNAASQKELKTFAVSIDSVELLTGIDFFPLLPDSEENVIEKTLCTDCWSWGKASKRSSKSK
ncbi:DNA/RNA non-specific endonuclease [Fluviicola sp.]|jgi:endonuclease G|uniref:DNA/RNA non-specific endonuclease n=1 Tax=Fluviicola sp. TaxID=1917219 RepID=UPI00283248D8|nr:DNA/RNA non-specific endonuclease [Fluviicola sp.]MDR0802526.1 DNA/RNA non-specific endonuclease [Fluviicola sp.]